MGSYNRQTIATALEAIAPAAQVCYQLGLDCGYAGPTIAGVEAAGEKSS